MSITARHKKPGGFKKLVNSLETTVLEKRTSILEAMRKEDPDFVSEVEQCIFNFEEFININDLVVAEIIAAFQKEMKTVAVALYKCSDKALLEKFTKNMIAPAMRAMREEQETLEQVRLNEQVGARFRIIAKARELEQRGSFQLKRYSQVYKD